MLNFWILFALTVLVAAYSGIMYFSGNINQNARIKKQHFGLICIIFIVLALIEIIFLNIS